MELLEQRILSEGRVLPGDILKVDSFLNHLVDPALNAEMGREAARLFSAERPELVLTVETSGIPFALATAGALGVPMLFAKKNRTGNLAGELLRSNARSYTTGRDFEIVIERRFLPAGTRVLLADDFLASGSAFRSLIALAGAAGAEVVGCVAAIEKTFQPGGRELRAEGLRVEALASIRSLGGGKIILG